MNFFLKTCQPDYECKSNKCVPIDSDKDGLTDIEERTYGTNPNLYDSDGDTLSDYNEIMILKTNPLNINTDSDRYNDNIDKDPLNKNSAHLNFQIIDKKWNWELSGIFGFLSENINAKIAKITIDLYIQNLGTDYTDYIRYELIIKIMNTEVKRIYESIGRLNPGESLTKHYEYELKISDVPNILVNALKENSNDWDIYIQNIQYERFE